MKKVISCLQAILFYFISAASFAQSTSEIDSLLSVLNQINHESKTKDNIAKKADCLNDIHFEINKWN